MLRPLRGRQFEVVTLTVVCLHHGGGKRQIHHRERVLVSPLIDNVRTGNARVVLDVRWPCRPLVVARVNGGGLRLEQESVLIVHKHVGNIFQQVMVAYDVASGIHGVPGVVDDDVVVQLQFQRVGDGIISARSARTAAASAGVILAASAGAVTTVKIILGGVHRIELEHRVHSHLVCAYVNDFREDTGFGRYVFCPIRAGVVALVDSGRTRSRHIVKQPVPEQRVVVRHNVVPRHILPSYILGIFVVDNDVVTQDKSSCVMVQYCCKCLLLKISLVGTNIHNLLKDSWVILQSLEPGWAFVAAVIHPYGTVT